MRRRGVAVGESSPSRTVPDHRLIQRRCGRTIIVKTSEIIKKIRALDEGRKSIADDGTVTEWQVMAADAFGVD